MSSFGGIIRRLLNYKTLIVLSFLFLTIFLFGTQTLTIPAFHSKWKFLIATVLLFLGMVFQGFNWYLILGFEGSLKFRDALASVGLTVFTKYIPGKVLVILGRADYINRRYDITMQSLIHRSFESQLLIIWVGLLIGVISLFWVGNAWAYAALGGVVALGLVLFTPLFHGLLTALLRRVWKKDLDLPQLRPGQLFRLLPAYAVYWLVLGIAFYFFQSAFVPQTLPVFAAFVFPLAATLGILALVVPGGIGVREGILATLMHQGGMDIPTAGAIAILSRFWFLGGEAFLFLLGWGLHVRADRREGKSGKTTPP